MPVKNNAENTPVSASAEVAPSADAISGSVNPNNPNNNSPKPLAAVDPVNVEPVLVGLGLTPSAIDVIRAANTEFEAAVGSLAVIAANDRRRFRQQARTDTLSTDRMKDLTGQFGSRVPGAAGNATLAALDVASDQMRTEVARLSATFSRLEDVNTLLVREFVRLARIARASLTTDSRYAGSELRQQLKLAGGRRRPKKGPAAGTATGTDNGTGSSTPTSPGGKPPTSPA